MAQYVKTDKIIVRENGKWVVMSAEEFNNAYDKRFDKKSGKVICTRKTVVADNMKLNRNKIRGFRQARSGLTTTSIPKSR